MIIRDAKAGDAAHIVRFWNPQIRDTSVTFTSVQKEPEQLAVDIAARQAEGRAFLVTCESDKVVGFATYTQFRGGPGYAHTMEHSVILDSSAWGAGTGRALMTELEGHAREEGVHSFVGCISAENPGGVAFHSKIGYRRVGTLPEAGFKFGRWMDLILMQKLL